MRAGASPPATPGRLVERRTRPSSAAPGWQPVAIKDGFYISVGGVSMTDQPDWVRVAGHLEEN